MKKKIKMILTLWLGMICNVAFGNGYAINNCKTVSECLQNAIEVDNKLVQENLELKKEIKDLKKNTEWVGVLLDDVQPFDNSCEYRATLKLDDDRFIYKEGTFYPSMVSSDRLVIIGSFDNCAGCPGVYAHYFIINKGSKHQTDRMLGKVFKIEKRCLR